jgi:hypothetical protein
VPEHTPDRVAEPDPHAAAQTATPIHADPTWPEKSERPDDSAETDKDAAQAGDDENGDEGSAGSGSLTHVPIKRKGSRKR